MPDIEPFISPIDGSVITGRRALEEHNKRHNVTNVADFKDEWERKGKERKKLFSPGSGYDRQKRREALARNYKEFKTYGEYQRHLEKLGRK
jgi:hypothetical protein